MVHHCERIDPHHMTALLARRPRRLALLLTLTLACSHADAFESGGYAPTGPFQNAVPRRVTLSTGMDRTPDWLPDESGFLYSYERLDREVQDRCIALLPAGGGSQVRSVCRPSPGAQDSIDAIEWPAAGPRDHAVVTAQGNPGLISPFFRGIEMLHAESPAPRLVLGFPRFSPTGNPWDGATHLRWLDPSALVFLGVQIAFPRPCSGCVADTVVTGVEIARLELAPGAPGPQVIPGTAGATSVDASDDGSTIYYTVAHDSRIFRTVLASGATDVLYDLGSPGLVRDVQVSGNRLVVIAGGVFDPYPTLGLEHDRGGSLYAVDLTSGQATEIVVPNLLFRHPALSPSGTRIVVEGYPVTPFGSISRSADIWLVEEP